MTGRLQQELPLPQVPVPLAKDGDNGKEATVLFTRERSRVFAVDVNRSAAEKTSRLIEKEGSTCESYATVFLLDGWS